METGTNGLSMWWNSLATQRSEKYSFRRYDVTVISMPLRTYRKPDGEGEMHARRAAFVSWRWLALASFLIVAPLIGVLIASRMRAHDRERRDQLEEGGPPSCQSVAPAIRSRIDRELQQLKEGKILFNLPQEMRVGNTEKIEVLISKSLVQELDALLKQRRASEVEGLTVGEYVGVLLTGTDGFFTIALKNHQEKIVAGTGYAEWLFDVTPLKPGTPSLYLTAYNVINTPDGARSYEHPPFGREVRVATTVPYEITMFIKTNWKELTGFIIASGIIGLSLGLVKKWKKRKGNKEPPSWERP